MPLPDIQTFSSPADLATAAANAWLEELAERPSSAPPYSAALSGGRITKAFFQAIVESAASSTAPIDRVHFFWADERCVPPEDPESNFLMADELLFQPLGIASECIHRIPGELPPEAAAAKACDDLAGFRELKGSGLPAFDMVFLGMGEDGHVASLFPGESKETINNPALYRPVVAVKPPPNRVTLGYEAIIAAKSVTALVSGAGKKEALRESLPSKGMTPMAKVIQGRDSIRILTDVEIETD